MNRFAIPCTISDFVKLCCVLEEGSKLLCVYQLNCSCIVLFEQAIYLVKWSSSDASICILSSSSSNGIFTKREGKIKQAFL